MGLPAQFVKPLRLALTALDEFGTTKTGLVSRNITSRVIDDCERAAPEVGDLIAFLRRLETESVLDEGNDFANRAAVYRLVQNECDPKLQALAVHEADEVSVSKHQCLLIENHNETDIKTFQLGYQKVA